MEDCISTIRLNLAVDLDLARLAAIAAAIKAIVALLT
jgi:hypothetical protein